MVYPKSTVMAENPVALVDKVVELVPGLAAIGAAGFLQGTTMQGPMGGSMVGFASPARAEEQRAMLGGRVMTWTELLADTASAGMGHH